MECIVAPSLLSCDFGHIASESEMLNQSEAQWFHLDVMDGVFVPNISFGLPIIAVFRKHTAKTLDVHLMIKNPDPYISDFRAAGADVLTVHYEACTHLHRTVSAIRAEGMRAGVALNPHTPVSVLNDIATEVDLILIMSVNPGFGGQKFIPHTLKKVNDARELIRQTGSKALIEVDGGVTLENAAGLKAAGANVLVAGNTVFKSANPTETIARLRTI